MKIAIVGAGFTGLSAAYKLALSGHKVVIYEKESYPGGLASGYKEKKWEWPLERHYHHLFASDHDMLRLCRQIGYPIRFYVPKTSTLYNSSIYQLDTPASLLSFPLLSLMEKLRTGLVLAFLKATPFWQPLEKFTAQKFLSAAMGIRPWKILWKPLFDKKFHGFSSQISATWFWARVHYRTQSLGYPEGGFDGLSRFLAQKLTDMGVDIRYLSPIDTISLNNNQYLVKSLNKIRKYDGVIYTLPVPQLLRMATFLSGDYKKSLFPIKGLGAVNLILSLKHQFLSDGTYWLNINQDDLPFLAIVDHTNFIDKSHYADEHLLYIGNYLPSDHPFFNYTAEQLLSEYLPGLIKINPEFKSSWVNKSWDWKAPYAQSVITPGFSRLVPSKITPYKNFILANIQQVYPWDRGTNYAVKIGTKAASYVKN